MGARLDYVDDPAAFVVQANADRFEAIDGLVRQFWPEGTDEETRMLSSLSMCLFTIDDELDAAPAPPSPVSLYADFLPWWPEGQNRLPLRQGVKAILREVELFLGRRSAFRVLGSLWHQEGEATLRAMRQEALWREEHATSNLETYLQVAQQSITTLWMAATLMILTSREWTSREIADAMGAARAVSMAIRLANDLRSFAREKSEGKVGAMAILARREEEEGLPADQAEARAQAKIRLLLDRAVLEALDRLGVERLPTTLDCTNGSRQVSATLTRSNTPLGAYERGLLGLLGGVLNYLDRSDFPRAVVPHAGGCKWAP